MTSYRETSLVMIKSMPCVREILLVMIKSMTYVRDVVGHDWSATTTVQWKDPTTLVSRPIKSVRLIYFLFVVASRQRDLSARGMST